MNVFLRDKHRGDGEHRLHADADAAASGRAVDIQRLDLPANDLRVLFLFRTHGYPQPHLAELRSGEHPVSYTHLDVYKRQV